MCGSSSPTYLHFCDIPLLHFTFLMIVIMETLSVGVGFIFYILLLSHVETPKLPVSLYSKEKKRKQKETNVFVLTFSGCFLNIILTTTSPCFISTPCYFDIQLFSLFKKNCMSLSTIKLSTMFFSTRFLKIHTYLETTLHSIKD